MNFPKGYTPGPTLAAIIGLLPAGSMDDFDWVECLQRFNLLDRMEELNARVSVSDVSLGESLLELTIDLDGLPVCEVRFVPLAKVLSVRPTSGTFTYKLSPSESVGLVLETISKSLEG